MHSGPASTRSQSAPDADGHILSLVASTGLASYPDGSIATVNILASTDYVKGSGTFVTYGPVTFRDGSALFTKSNATGATDGTKAPTAHSTFAEESADLE